MTNTDTATITLTNAHGAYTADCDQVSMLLTRTASWGLEVTRRHVAGCVGHDLYKDPFADYYRDCTWLELCIIWADSGNA